MSDSLSSLPRVSPDKAKAQWMLTKYIHSDTETEAGKRLVTHHYEIPFLMPGTIIFVHGVNSEGEWYQEANYQFCKGLNKRLGRTSLDSPQFNRETMRFLTTGVEGQRANSPIIPFYWGYKLQPGDLNKYPGIYHREDNAWGGGPFQNGTNNLLQFWHEGFKRKVLNGWIDLQAINTDITRQLQDAPPRSYFIHAARRLARLIDTIREDFPNEPLNIVAHSQGNMIALCAMLYVKSRAPDTLILNSAPYSFDSKITDWLGAAGGWSEVQSKEARFQTFQAVAQKLTRARLDYKAEGESVAKPGLKLLDVTDDKGIVHRCGLEGDDREKKLFVHHEPNCENWQRQIGTGEVGAEGQPWYECPFASRENRGKIFVNFNPHDRVIGIAAVEGIGWRGLPDSILGENWNRLPNVYQRIFARNSGAFGVPPVGSSTNYWFSFFHEQLSVAEDVRSEHGIRWVSSDGRPMQTKNNYLRTFDGKHVAEFWHVTPGKVLRLVDIQGSPGERTRVWINAPTVPEPVKINENFEEGTGTFDGSDSDDQEQRDEFSTYSRHYVPQTITTYGADHSPITRQETPEEVKARLADYAKRVVPKTNHSQILRYGSRPGEQPLVEKVLTYDLTIGQGYAFGDADYWQYLLDLADWKISDPYYIKGSLPPAGPYPEGLDTETVMPKG